jgi:polysaccharide export outer membrane protein
MGSWRIRPTGEILMRQAPPVVLTLLLLCFGSAPSPAQVRPDASRPADTTPDYRIGVEDLLEIVVWGEENLSVETKVRPDGKITVPLANDVLVRGRTPSEVVAVLTERLGQYVREPHVTVIVREINSFKVFFVGEINTQGVIQLYRPTRLLQAIAMGGGLTEFSKKEIVIIREEGNRQRRMEINYKQLASGESPELNIYLKPDDTVVFK